MDERDAARIRATIAAEHRRSAEQVAALEGSFAGIVEAAQSTSTDDEHDPEGATIAYERAQVSALLRQARDDLAALDAANVRLADGSITTCVVCGGPIPIDRILALPTAKACVRCAA